MKIKFGEALQSYYLGIFRKNYADRRRRLEAIKDLEEAKLYQAEVKAKIRKAFNLPDHDFIPECEITGVIEQEDFVIKKLIYYSRKNYPVTADLYLPKIEGKIPAVLFLCGHNDAGKAAEPYQSCCLNLVRMNYAVLAVDPVSQGERLQFTADGNGGFLPPCCTEHNMLGKQLNTVGEFLGGWRAHDAICGLNYLLSLPQIDRKRVGITGNSGGGTMTTFVSALDDRFTMTAPSCYVCNWVHNVENELPADSEQIPPGIVGENLEMGDFFIAQAPRPVLILGQKNDFFDPRGVVEVYDELKNFYRFFDAGNQVEMFVGPGSHGYSQENREAMYRFFNCHAGVSGSSAELPVRLFTPAELAAAPQGEVERLPGNKHTRDFIREIAGHLSKSRRRKSAGQLIAELKKLLNLTDTPVPYYRVLRPEYHESILKFTSRFGIESEPDQIMAVLKIYAEQDFYHLPVTEKIELYLPDSGCEPELSDFSKNKINWGLDIRGMGELLPGNCDQTDGDYYASYGFDYHYAALGRLSRNSLFGGRIKDILSVIKLFKFYGAEQIVLNGCGNGAILTAFAGLLSDIPVKVKFSGLPESFESLISQPYTRTPASMLPENILTVTDIPEILSFLDVLELE